MVDTKKQIQYHGVDDLLLDSENPRLAIDGKKPSQDQLLAKLYESESLEELAVSFAKSGYFAEEPLVVIPHKSIDKFLVVEGNRRLATLKLLLSPSARKTAGAVGLPELSSDQRNALKDIPTVEYATREEVAPYLGYRHITGAKKWEPYAKARYVHGLISGGRSIDEIEEIIGDAGSAVKKLYQAYIVFCQVRDDLDEDVAPIRESFSLLEVTLGQQPIKEFLAIERKLPDSKTEQVVSKSHLKELGEIVQWVFGSKKKGIRPAISDSREISKWLAPVVVNKESLAYLRKNRDLERAYELSDGERQFVVKKIQAAHRATKAALGSVSAHKKDEEVRTEVAGLLETVTDLSRVCK